MASVPNVLWVVFDDLGTERDELYWRAPVSSSEIVVCPEMRAQYASGVRFTKFRGMPWCTPGRSSSITGRHPHSHSQGGLAGGVNSPLPLDEMCLPRALRLGREGDVETAAFGKHHLSNRANGGMWHPILMGYDFFAGTVGNLDGANESYYEWTRWVARPRAGAAVSNPETRYAEEVVVEDALKWITSRSGIKPWFANVSFHLPHATLHRPPEGTYDATKFVLEHLFPQGADETRDYHKAMIQTGDYYLGQLLAGIPKEVLGNTVVMVWSDNGTQESVLPSPYRVGDVGSIYSSSHAKRTVYDLGIRTSMSVSGPGVDQPGRVSEAVVCVTDLYATVAEIMGADLALAPSKGGNHDSISFVPVLASRSAASPRTMGLSEIWAPNQQVTAASLAGNRCVYSVDYKLVRTSTGLAFPDAGVQLYDIRTRDAFGNEIVTDPDELTNLTPAGSTAGLNADQLAGYNALVTYYQAEFATP